MKSKYNIIPALLLLILVAFNVEGIKAQNDNYFEISKNLDIFSNLYKQLDINYVDDISPGDFMKTGIDAMLDDLDPYTVYISESEIEDYRFMTTGQYGGIGALIHMQDGFAVVSEPYKNSPAEKAGLKPGDRIIAVNGKSTKGKSTSDISSVLKGQPGTDVKLTVERPFTGETLEKSLTREKIKVDNIPYYGMVSEGIGYIKLSGFTQKAGNEVKEAFESLQKQGELKGLIFDLRGNGGGLLHEAVNICNLFVDKDQLIVKTKGKLPRSNNSYKTRIPAYNLEIPLVVLINSKSASASEIVAGALQDLDRAVVIGQRSFGKGLVQNVLPLSYNSQVKITVAKYYIPSGRCIQAIDYSHKNGEGVFKKIPDSLISEFKTKNGRKVYDGGGIEPDINIDIPKYSRLTKELIREFMVFDFANKFSYDFDSIADPESFTISDEIFNDFNTYIVGREFSYVSQCEEMLENIEEISKKERVHSEIEAELDALQAKIKSRKSGSVEKFRDEIEALLKPEIVTRYYFQQGRIRATLAEDPEILKAIEVIENKKEYAGILSSAPDTEN